MIKMSKITGHKKGILLMHMYAECYLCYLRGRLTYSEYKEACTEVWRLAKVAGITQQRININFALVYPFRPVPQL